MRTKCQIYQIPSHAFKAKLNLVCNIFKVNRFIYYHPPMSRLKCKFYWWMLNLAINV